MKGQRRGSMPNRFLLALLVLFMPSVSRSQAAPCPAPDTLAPWMRVLRVWKTESPGGWRNDSLRRVLIDLAAEDQAVRRDFGTRAGDSAYARTLIADDSVRAARMRGILSTYGLPTRSMVGAAGADAAMLMVQHNGTLQAEVLGMARRLPAGEVSPEAFAMLEDRVAVSEGRPQRFGTQFTLGTDTIFRFAPVAEPRTLAGRRANAGLPPMPLYVCWLEESGMRVDHRSLPPMR